MKILFRAALIIVAVTLLIHAQERQLQLSPSEINSLATVNAKPNYESLFANVNGVRIHYLKSGSGKTPLVLIHGFGDDARMWLPLFG